MLKKKRFITATVLVVVTITIVIAVATVAGILFLSSSGDTVAILGATSVGAPTGPAATKSIGPEGGTISSPDGRIKVDVPPNAVPGPVDFSIQPITNLAHGGVGNAYRLEPSEKQFATPVRVSFSLDAQDLKGIIPEGLSVAYQDKAGVWQALKTAKIDRATRALTVSTTHFTDWSVWTISLKPKRATLRLRETQYIELIGCLERLNPLARIKTLLGRPDCAFISPQEESWTVDFGTITRVAPGAVVYQAPAERPSTGVATVRYVYKLPNSPEANIKDVRTCVITIVGQGYKASGNFGPNTISGTICDLEKPFTVQTSNQLMSEIKFQPTSSSTGAWSYSYHVVSGGGGGSYTLEGPENQRTGIVMNGSGTAWRGPVGGTSGGTLRVILTPLEPNEQCSGK